MNKIDKVADDLLKTMEHESHNKIDKLDPLTTLRTSIFAFFESQMDTIGRREKILAKAQIRLEDFLDNSEVPLETVVNIYRLVSTQSGQAAESLIGLFRPTPGAGSPLAAAMSKTVEEEDPAEVMFKSMTPAQLEKLDLMYRLFQSMVPPTPIDTVDTETIVLPE